MLHDMFIVLTSHQKRLQSDNFNNPQYNGVWDCVRKSYCLIPVFYTGLTLALLRAFPMHASVFITMELSKMIILTI